MPRPEQMRDARPVTRAELQADLRRLGVGPGAIVMVHASLRALGWVVGGAQTVVEALTGRVGTRRARCARRRAGRTCRSGSTDTRRRGAGPTARRCRRSIHSSPAAAPYEGRLAERIRTWPGAVRGAHPVAGVTAVGARAGWLVEPHPLDDGFGTRSPYARLAAAGGEVVLLGAPLRTISLLHHAESIAAVPKRWTWLTLPIRSRSGAVAWVEWRELDVWGRPVRYPDGDAPPLETVARAALAAGVGQGGRVGEAAAWRFPAAALVAFAARWIERNCGSRRSGSERGQERRGRCRRARAARDAARRRAAGPAPAGRRTTARDRSRCPVAHGRARPSRRRPRRAR